MNISVIIPAFNEEGNIKPLINNILSQKGNFNLLEIIILLDGSTDNTKQEIKKIKNKKILLISKIKRLGKSIRLNQLLRIAKGDIIISCDADIKIVNMYLFQNILENFNAENGLGTVQSSSLNKNTLVEKALSSGEKFKNILKKKWNNGDNYLAYCGSFLIYSKKFAKKVTIPSNIINDDAYIYFKAKQLGYNPLYLSNLELYYKLPSSYNDHLNQSTRFKSSWRELKKYFPPSYAKAYRIPKYLILESALITFLDNPLYFIMYIFLLILTYLNKSKVSPIWDVALSTK